MNMPSERQAVPLETSSGPHSPPPSEKGALKMLMGVFFQPQATFRAVGQKPIWFVPVLACVLLALVTSFYVINKIGVSNIMRSAMQGNPRADEIVRMAEQSSTTKIMMYVAAPVQVPIVLLALSGVFLLGLMLTGNEIGFKKVFTVVAYAFFAYSFVASLLTAVTVAAARDFANFDIRNPIATNAGFWLDPAETSKFLYSLASSVDVLSFWFLYLLALGFVEASLKPRQRKPLALIVGIWAVYAIGKAASSSLFG